MTDFIVSTDKYGQHNHFLQKLYRIEEGHYDVGSVNYYHLTSILEDLYVENQELKSRVEALNPTERRQIVVRIWNLLNLMLGTMTERNLTQELLYTNYIDMENGDDVETIDYRSLIHIITELMIGLSNWKK
jgi:hypothetical protein